MCSLQYTWRVKNACLSPKFRAHSVDWDLEGVWYSEDSEMEAIWEPLHTAPLQTKIRAAPLLLRRPRSTAYSGEPRRGFLPACFALFLCAQSLSRV